MAEAKQVKPTYKEFLKEVRAKQFGHGSEVTSIESELTKPAKPKKKAKKEEDK